MTKPPAPWVERAGRILDEEAPYSFGPSQLNQVLAENEEKMRIPSGLAFHDVVDALINGGVFGKEKIQPLSSPKDGGEYRVIERFVRKAASAVHVALSLRPNSYLSHASAAQHHGLIPASLERIYVNKEQSPKPEGNGTLTQEGIDRAFANVPRVSNLVYGFKKTEIVWLSGKNTGNHGVTTSNGKLGANVQVTSIERTLVDITVRPAYAGGVQAVLSAFVAARSALSVPSIVAALKALQYIYPYHQALGFYLQRAGLPAAALAPLKKFPIDFNFYLANRIAAPTLDREWRVYYPPELDGAESVSSASASGTRRQVARK